MATGFKTRKIVGADGSEGRGMKVTKNTNVVKILEWVEYYGGEGFAQIDQVYHNGEIEIADRIKVKTKKGLRVAKIGDVVVKNPDGSFFVIKAEDFENYLQV